MLKRGIKNVDRLQKSTHKVNTSTISGEYKLTEQKFNLQKIIREFHSNKNV